MDTSHKILGVIAFVVFHLAVTLPLATVTTRELVMPWVRSVDQETPEWVAIVLVFLVMALAFALRGHVLSAKPVHHHHHPA